jgi:hypothetical protein
MTIKINVGVNKKIGLPNYGSAGSHCNVEIEADNAILDNAEQFLQRVRDAYEAARKSVEEELAHHRPSNSGQSSDTQSNREPEQQQRQEYRQEYRNDNRSDYRNSSSASSGGTNYVASAKQQQFIASLVKAVKGLDWHKLDKYCQTKFGRVCRELSSKEASALIDDLQAAKSGRGGLPV